MDYWNVLTEEHRAWLNQFNNEYERAYFKADLTRLHDTRELYKDCNDRANKKRRDAYHRWVIVELPNF